MNAQSNVIETDFYGDALPALAYAVEPYLAVVTEMRELYPEHLGEVESAFPLEMDYLTYDLLARTGVLHVVTARDGSGKLVGYAMMLVHPHLHHRSVLTAVSDAFYLKPEQRKGLAGYKLLKFTIEAMKERGAQQVYIGTAASFDLGPILERLGFKLAESVYQKVF